MLLCTRVDVGPRPRAPGHDVQADLHRRRIVEGPGAHRQELRVLLALAVNVRATVRAEVAMQRAPAVRDGCVALERALGHLECLARQHHVDRAARAGDLLAALAMAGTQLGDRHADGIADHAAKTASGERGHMVIPFASFEEPQWCPNIRAYMADVAVLYEHPEWQKPLFAALERRGVRYAAVDLKHAAFAADDRPLAPLYFNHPTPSAYVRGDPRAVPYALAYMRALETRGVRVLNGSAAFALELSKTAQAALLRELDIPAPRSWTFNDVSALHERAAEIPFPVLLKPEQGGSGARIVLVDCCAQLEALRAAQPDYWLPDTLLLLQESIASDPARGIGRMEFLGGELPYAMRVISHGRFNLCPSPVCNPEDGGDGVCEVPVEQVAAPPAEFYPYPEVPA